MRRMDVVTEIMDALGGQAAVARAMRAPPQTVSDWTRNGIPPWRRPLLRELPVAEGKKLSRAAIEYLASTARTPKPAPAQDRAA
jgi:hypothetical protein